MKTQFTAYDEVFGGVTAASAYAPIRLELVSETLTAREIILEKARVEYDLLAQDHKSEFKTRNDLGAWLMQAGELPSFIEEAEEIAIKAFSNQEFFFFWNDEQVTDLDKRLQTIGENNAKFIRLIPLKGG